jgi:peptide/nickel transport system ATP-binding protein
MIDVSNLTIRFSADGPAAVDDVSFSVGRGESFGLVGESGSGKSTVLRAVAGLNSDVVGDIRVDGVAVGPKRPRDFFRKVQMVFQDPYGSLHPRQTIQAQLTEPLYNQGLPRDARVVEEALEAVGLPAAMRFRYPHQLSGGQRQRVAIARALMLKPEIVLLDEPTSALDVSVQAEVLNLLSDMRERLGLTYILVSHDLAVVSHMCDRLAVMRAGRIVDAFDAEHLRRGDVDAAYSRDLLAASEAYGERPRQAGS